MKGKITKLEREIELKMKMENERCEKIQLEVD
jgi:hypothetical protein